jgi:uncharacterized membrane protein YeaQ/YmgE (transglycosylase-associated protein family)
MMFNAPSDVWQIMHDEGTVMTVFMTIIGSIILSYIVLYHFIDHPSLNKRRHLWMFITATAGIVFAFTLYFVPQSVNRGFQRAVQLNQQQENLDLGDDGSSSTELESPTSSLLGNVTNLGTLTYRVLDAIPIALAATFWTVILYGLLSLSPFPRRYSTNCRTLKIF